MKIRSERPSDAAGIEVVTVAAFRNAAHSDHMEHFIVRALRNAGALSVSLVAEDAGVVVGHVAVSPVTISGAVAGWYGLGPVSVAPAQQNAGIGSRLVYAALNTLRTADASGCVVLGEPGYYARFGFAVDPRLVLPGVPPAYFQTLSFGGLIPVGSVAYHDAFSAMA